MEVWAGIGLRNEGLLGIENMGFSVMASLCLTFVGGTRDFTD